ncbi:MAG: hemolysin family protein [Mucinivorans sp.]
MDSSIIVIIIVSLVLSAFFSAAEIAFISSNKLLLEIDKKHSPLYERIVTVFLASPAQYISSILVGNNIALVVFSLFMSRLLYPMSDGNLAVETLVSTVIVVFVAEFLPKALVRSAPNFYLRIFAVPIYFFYWVFYPIASFATFLSRALLRMVGLRADRSVEVENFDKNDLQYLVQSEIESPTPTDNEIKIFQNALDFSQVKVRDCMIPRVDITAFDIKDSVAQLSAVFVKTKFSRIPVFRHSIDNIVGYASSRQLFESPVSVEAMLRPTIFTPPGASVQRLLAEFIKTRCSVAVVIDEFGGTAGMVTLEDILEEIFGEIDDEHDADYLVDKTIKDGEYLFSGRLEIEYLNEKYELNIPESDDYDTLAGYLLHHSGEIPSVGEVFDIDGLRLRVVKCSVSRVSLINVTTA